MSFFKELFFPLMYILCFILFIGFTTTHIIKLDSSRTNACESAGYSTYSFNPDLIIEDGFLLCSRLSCNASTHLCVEQFGVVPFG